MALFHRLFSSPLSILLLLTCTCLIVFLGGYHLLNHSDTDCADHTMCPIDGGGDHVIRKRHLSNRLWPADNGKSNQTLLGTKKFPQAIIIGVKKGGTRALLEYLRLHPLIRAPGPEVHFFDRYYHLGLEWYRQRMPSTLPGQLTIEKTPSYFIRREVPARIYKMSPKTKILIVVRNPVTRAISDYTQSLTKRRTSKKFEDLAFLDSSSDRRVIDVSWSAIRIGFYYKHTQKWLRYFPRSQIHFVSGENLITHPVEELKLVEKFLDLPAHIEDSHFYYNVTKGFPCVKKRPDSGYQCLGKTKGRAHPKVDKNVVRDLSNFYRSLNQAFFNLTTRDFGWNDEDIQIT